MKSISFLTSWLKDIVIVFIFISIVELAIPKGNMKKYINMVFGFLIIIVIISPFVKLINSNFSFTKDLYKNQIMSMKFQDGDNLELAKTQEEQIKNLYTAKIEEEIKDVISQHTQYIIEKIDFEIDDGKEDFGRILAVEILLNENKELAKDEKIQVKKIKDIDVSKTEDHSIEYYELNHKGIEKELSQKYNLPKNKIKILINKRVGESGGEIQP